MPLKSYLITIYLAFFTVITTVLCGACCIIELVEKLRFINSKGLGTVLTYAAWQAVPLFVSTLPITLWLAVLATHYHLHTRNERHILTILGVRRWQQSWPLMLAICSLSLTLLLLKRPLIEPGLRRAVTQRRQLLAAQPTNIIEHFWQVTDQHQSFYSASFDTTAPSSQTGLCITSSPNGSILTVTKDTAPPITHASEPLTSFISGLSIALMTALILGLTSTPLLYGLAIYPIWLALTLL